MAIDIAVSGSSAFAVQGSAPDDSVPVQSTRSAAVLLPAPGTLPFARQTLENLGLAPIVDSENSAAALAQLALKLQSIIDLSKLASSSATMNALLGSVNNLVGQLTNSQSELAAARTKISANETLIAQLTADQVAAANASAGFDQPIADAQAALAVASATVAGLTPGSDAYATAAAGLQTTQDALTALQSQKASYDTTASQAALTIAATQVDTQAQQAIMTASQANVAALTTGLTTLALAFSAILNQSGQDSAAGGSLTGTDASDYITGLAQQMAPRQAPVDTGNAALFNNDETRKAVDQDRLQGIMSLVMHGVANVMASMFDLLTPDASESVASPATAGGRLRING